MNYTLFLTLLLVTMTGLAASTQAQDTSDEQAIEVVLRDYVEGADARDADRIASALDDASMQYILAQGRYMTISRDQYLGLIAAERIGGEERTLTINSVEIVNENAALATIEVQGGAHFTQFVGLVKKPEVGWAIASVVTSVR